MKLSVCGINYRSGSLEDREPFQIIRTDLAKANLDYRKIAGCDGVIVLSTCNRIEFYRAGDPDEEQVNDLIDFYSSRGIKNTDILREITYSYHRTTAARHLFRVASGLDSLVLGENQIYSQVKDAYSIACSVGTPEKLLHKVFHFAFQVAKQIRTETGIISVSRSIPRIALEMFREKTGEPVSLKALVIGVNPVTEILLENLSLWGADCYLANRTVYNAEKIAANLGVTSIELEKIPGIISDMDVVYSATSASDYILKTSELPSFDERKRPLYMFDLAVPRDIEPSVSRKEGVKLYDLQDLKIYQERSAASRSNREVPLAEDMVSRQVYSFSEWRNRDYQRDRILNVREKLNKIRKTELEHFQSGFRESDKKALKAFSKALLRQFLKITPELMKESPEDLEDAVSEDSEE